MKLHFPLGTQLLRTPWRFGSSRTILLHQHYLELFSAHAMPDIALSFEPRSACLAITFNKPNGSRRIVTRRAHPSISSGRNG